ncbi:extracellular solute-binding protein [Actinomadura sp. DC4]|uniref:extracellular solute-binding protein n=1 Tax=Actinomadura sp. DC4 TaxID=3055069 RepID=UPI0025AF5F91|nr:extracellular solute-binding protein [Actinomadura sp. DC4]MDN3354702.1 extracellular solute-binding protein [Actinomadura sp. DC4]
MPADKIAINVWLNEYPFPGFLDPLKEAAATFGAAHPEYEVNIQGRDFRTMPTHVARGIAKGETPDLVEFFYTSTQLALDTLGRDGEPLFTPIGPAIGGRTEILGEPVLVDDVIPAARDFFTGESGRIAMPPTASTVLLYANTTLLASAGVTSVPRTWAEVEAACRAVARLAGGPAHRIAWPNHMWMFLQAMAQQGGRLVDHDNGRSGRAEKISLVSDEMTAFFTWWQRLHRDGHFFYSGEQSDWMSCFKAFGEQGLAFILSSSVDASRLIRQGREAGFTVEAAPMPYNDEVPYAGNLMGGDGMWLAAGLDPARRDGALAFMQHVIKPEHAVEWHKFQGRLPITRTAVRLLEEEGWFTEHPERRVASDQLEASAGLPGTLGPIFGEFAGIQKEITSAMHDVLTGDAEPVARFTQANTEAQQLLDAYNAHCAGPPRRSPDSMKVAW